MGRGPVLPDLETFWQAGIDPRTGLPVKMGGNPATLYEDIRKNFRVMDEQTAVNRYVWYNLPGDLNGTLLERMLYYKGQLCMFYVEENEKFYIMPYALSANDGIGLDVYGRFTEVTPVPFCSGAKDMEDKPWIPGLTRKVCYSIEDALMADPREYAIIIKDYTSQLSEIIIPRSTLQNPILNTMAEVYPMARTNLISNSGAKGVRVNNNDEQASVREGCRTMQKAVLTGDAWVPIIGAMEFQELGEGTPTSSEEYLLYLQSLNNFRQSQYGLSGGKLFEKQAHTLQSEQEENCASNILIYQDGFSNRSDFVLMANTLFGTQIVCEPHPIALGMPQPAQGGIGNSNGVGEGRPEGSGDGEGGGSDE